MREDCRVKRPWLLTQTGMRLSVVVAILLPLLLIWPAIEQVEKDLRTIPQLDPTSLSYCELESCGYIEELGIEVLSPPQVSEGAYGTEIWVQVVNKDRRSNPADLGRA